MGSRTIAVHDAYTTQTPDEETVRALRRLRAERTDALARKSGDDRWSQWRVRRFPVLAALAPVMTSPEGDITYPGDPMCLYAALSVTVNEAMHAASVGLGQPSAFPDLCPDWRRPPSKSSRMHAEHGDRPSEDSDRDPDGRTDDDSDASVFDPRVWDETARERLRAVVRRRRPRVLLVSTVSPGHRYALQMARVVKGEEPRCLVVFGGRHIDETMRYSPATDSVDLAYSSTIRAIDDGRSDPVVDFLVSGEGYFALRLLMQAIALAMDVDTRYADVPSVIRMLDLLGAAGEPVPGRALLCAITPQTVHSYPIKGPAYDPAELPSPYRGFAVRARFPVFPMPDGSAARTAHLAVTNACPYHCDFCSEGSVVTGGLQRFRSDPALAGLERICEYVSYGAEAVFFDDSVFWAGSFSAIREFCGELIAARNGHGPGSLPTRCRKWLEDAGDWERLRRLRFGCQLTVDLLTTLHKEDEVASLLRLMKQSGCTYLYIGIESMSSRVMGGVHKNLRRSEDFPWREKVRTALERIRRAGIPVGSSVLFGLEGENRDSIDETVEEVGKLIDDDLVMLASPNILTYHPATALTRMHGMADHLDYHSPDLDNRPPYQFFEEAFPGVVSKNLSEQDVWHIHRTTADRWGTQRNSESAQTPVTVDQGRGGL